MFIKVQRFVLTVIVPMVVVALATFFFYQLVISSDATYPYKTWQAAGQQLLKAQIPLWDNQPLLEATNLPIFYPFSIIYYLTNSLFLFGIIHLCLFSVGYLCLMYVWSSLSQSLKVVFVMLCLGCLVIVGLYNQPDTYAALAWLPLALGLVLWKRRSLAFLALPLILGLIALAAPFWLTIVLYLTIGLGWYAFLAPQMARAWLISALVLAILGGYAIAGPQVFPRQNYDGNYNPSLQSVVVQASSNLAQINRVTDKSNGQIELNIEVPAFTKELELVVTGRDHSSGVDKPTGWTAQAWLGDNVKAKKGLDVKVSSQAGAMGDQRIIVKFAEAAVPSVSTAYTVLLKYNPLSFTLGLYSTFLTFACIALILVVLGWQRFYQEQADASPLSRVIKNSTTPLFAQLSGKILDFGYAIIVLRLLGPDGNGQYTFAVTTWLLFATICDFGLESYVTREIARARLLPDAHNEVNRLFVTKLVLRLLFSVAALPLSLVWLAGFNVVGSVSSNSAWAVVLLMLAFLPSAITGSVTVVFRGYEKFEYLAAAQMLTVVIKIPLGLTSLLLGWGVIGLAATSIVVNIVNTVVLQLMLNKQVFRPRLTLQAFDRKLAIYLLSQSFPLMLNSLIISILFKSDGLILQAFKGDTQLGLYNSAYKFIDGLLIIPSALTLALFPLFSTYGIEAKENLLRAYREGLRLLMIIGLPIVVGVTFVAYDLIGAVGGAEFLPDGAIAFQILIWFLPLSYINGIVQYVLIAINKQRSITVVVIVAAVSNVVLNILLIPYFGYVASALLTILTEVIIFVPFSWIMRKELGREAVPYLETTWRPVVASFAMAVVLGSLLTIGINHFVVTVVVGVLVYLGGLMLTRAVTSEDIALLRRVIKRK